MKNRYLWMLVTADKYELPMVVEESSVKLAKILGINSSSVINATLHNYSGKNTGRKIVKVAI